MPYSPPRLCSHPGCGILGKHCHRSESDKRRGSAASRGYDRHWQLRRARKLKEEPLCRICKEVRGRIVAAETVDHIRPKAKGGSDDWHNLQSLCFHDNSAKGDRDNDEYRSAVKRDML